MNNIRLLDCTLRDGGYCNDCHFGFENEKEVVSSLVDANVDIIECGFLMNTVKYDRDRTRFTSLDQVAKIIPEDRNGKLFVMLTDYGKYNLDDLPEYDGTSVDGLRVAFHKKDRYAGLEECRQIKAKGYKVFIQAMVSVSYTDEEFVDLLQRVNEIEPYAFYIVDSFGMMSHRDIIRLFSLVEHNLKDTIYIGFHAHNNMQMAFANAQFLAETQTNRDLIIDSSLYGMGRGAGNLTTELFMQYLNRARGSSYDIHPVLHAIDDVIAPFFEEEHWGYSLPNYLSASHSAHPNYAGYLQTQEDLTVQDMNNIFDMMDSKKKFNYDKNYIAALCDEYRDLCGKKSEADGVVEFPVCERRAASGQ